MCKRNPKPKKILPVLAAFLAFFFLAGGVCAQRGAITRPQNLNELVDESAVIVRGQVMSARVEPHPQYSSLSTVVVTLRVRETMKGQAGETYTFRQFIWDIRDRGDAAGYRKGQQLLLLLIAPNANGLSSPAGLEQGRFRIQRDAQGRESATNGYDNAGLFRDVQKQAAKKGTPLSQQQARIAEEHRSGPLALDDLRGMIRQLAGAK